MKKLLLSSVAVCGLSVMAAPAQAGVDLELGGWFKGYGVFIDQDTATNQEEREFDILRNTELHFTGETTLDNGLTVGYHFETEGDNNDSLDVEESYAYFSGGWGRVNFGAEDGAAYLLQVEAPSADGNVDGIRQYIDGVNYDLAPGTIGAVFDGFTGTDALIVANTAAATDDVRAIGALDFAGTGEGDFDLFAFDYDDDITSYSNKLTYLTPIFGGFQAGVSYTPDVDREDANDDTTGVNSDDTAGDYGDAYEIAARYEGQFDGFGVIVGAGFSHAELEEDQNLVYVDTSGDGAFTAGTDTVVSARDDRQSWNAGIDLDIGPFGVGVAYVEDDLGVDNGADRETIAVGADYTTGPFKLGASYYTQDQETEAFLGDGSGDLETDRYTGGVVYTYGPGMTFRGSVSYIEHELDGTGDVEATSVLLGTQIKF